MAFNAKYNGTAPCSICGEIVRAGQRVEFQFVGGKRSVVHVHEAPGASNKAREWNSGKWEPAKVAARLNHRGDRP